MKCDNPICLACEVERYEIYEFANDKVKEMIASTQVFGAATLNLTETIKEFNEGLMKCTD